MAHRKGNSAESATPRINPLHAAQTSLLEAATGLCSQNVSLPNDSMEGFVTLFVTAVQPTVLVGSESDAKNNAFKDNVLTDRMVFNAPPRSFFLLSPRIRVIQAEWKSNHLSPSQYPHTSALLESFG